MTKANVVLQYEGISISNAELVARVKEIWKEEKKSLSDIEDLVIYVKPEEYKAYYVINGVELGSVDLNA